MLARKVGEMLNMSPRTQDTRTTGPYFMVASRSALYCTTV
jgi:hypothetical protein